MKKRLIIMIILTITLISIVSLGSYALFTSKQEQGSNNTLTTNNCLNITFQNETNALNLTNEYPKTDEKGLNGKTYIFKINNTCNNYLAVNIKLNVDATLTTLPTNKIKIAVNKKYDEPNIKLLANFSNTDNIYTLINDGINPNSSNTYEYRMWVDYTADETVSNLTFKSQIEVEGILTKQEPHGWSNAQNGTLLYAIRNNNEVTKPLSTPGESPSFETRENAVTGTLNVAASYKNYYFTYGTGYTQNSDGTYNLTGETTCQFSNESCRTALTGNYIVNGGDITYAANSTNAALTSTNLPAIVEVTSIDYNGSGTSYVYFKQYMNASEKVLASTQDDYGTSYYFRGSIDNNYVNFAGKCWRIVRIDGNGNIKLILQNNNGTDCTVANIVKNTAFNGQAGVYNYNAGIGFMYGTPNSSTLYSNNGTGEHDNVTDSTILSELKTWYNTAIIDANLENYLADVIWCGDKSLNSNTAGTGLGQTGSNTTYGAYQRIYSNKNPSLVCPTSYTHGGTTYNIGNLSKYTAKDTTNGNGLLQTTDNGNTKYYKVGLLTVDEVTYAGGYKYNGNPNFYLNINKNWWTISPCYFTSSNPSAHVWNVYGTGYLYGNNVTYGYGVRPAVSLKSTVTISGGTGTALSPYIVNGV